MSNKKSIPITILTGFLGSGKTTLVNKIISENDKFHFGVIVNEFGEVGIDNEIIEKSEDEIVELSNGCMCCIVRTDLYSATKKLLDTNPEINYIIIETSGLSEAKPIADTFIMNDHQGLVYLDSIVCVLDCKNHQFTNQNYKVAIEQIKYSDFLYLNKIDESVKEKDISTIKEMIKKLNPASVILEGVDNTSSLIDQQIWDIDRLEEVQSDNKAHHHTHEHFQEVVYTTKEGKVFDANKLDKWLLNSFPEGCLRSKGIMNIKIEGKEESSTYLFQMVGASKMLNKFESTKNDIDLSYSRIVFIGNDLNEEKISRDLESCIIK